MDLFNSLKDHAVLQRNAADVSEHIFYGKSSASGKVLLTVLQAGKVLKGFEALEVGSAARGKVKGCLKGLPVGGPYTLKLKIEKSAEKITVKDVLVGDLWLLAGQSNMADSGFMPSMTEKCNMVHAFYMTNNWDVAENPLHDVAHAVAPVHGGNPNNPYTKRLRGTGPGLPFGVEMYKATKVPQGLIACAHGGTSLAQWNPALKKMGGESLYGAAYERLQMLGGKVAGLLWYQGCNEVGSAQTVDAYEATTRKLFAAFRRDCKNPDMPIVLAQLAANIYNKKDELERAAGWFKIQQAQYRIGQTLKNTACVPTIDLELDDLVHLSNQAVHTLGKRFAAAMLRLQGKDMPPEIEPGRISITADRPTNTAIVTVKFKNVQGSLQAAGLPCGFAVVDSHDRLVSDAVNCRLEGDKAIIHTNVNSIVFARTQRYRIAYGGALQPHANITDEAGRSLPCFVLNNPYNSTFKVTEMVEDALISEPVFTDDSFAALAMPENADELQYSKADFSGFYLPVPRAGALDREHKVFVYKFRAKLDEDMKLMVLFGADAPFILYADDREIARICTGNPVIPDEFKIPLELTAGEHEFKCVFSGNGGSGWGICCRMQRMDGKTLPYFAVIEK